MTSLITLAGGGLLLLATPAIAQDSGAPPPPEAQGPAGHGEHMPPAAPPPADAGAAAATAATAATARSFTDAEVAGFAQAMVAIRGLPAGEEAARREQALAILANAGIDAATYNAIGRALGSDEALAARVQAAMPAAADEPAG